MTKIFNLYEVGKTGAFCVVSTPSIGLLESIGLRAGTEITIENRYALGGPVLLKVKDAYSLAVGKDIAKQIMVRRILTPRQSFASQNFAPPLGKGMAKCEESQL